MSEKVVIGECDLCGEWASHLVGGVCAPCRDKYAASAAEPPLLHDEAPGREESGRRRAPIGATPASPPARRQR